ncbi:pentatricopeptide repeat-containing protein At1g71210, mitochondrial [Nymphaea colorata]|nr:pentatricopeptide repeat-containing protein At1g71210, mitochondrial [Nymphaea colorata]
MLVLLRSTRRSSSSSSSLRHGVLLVFLPLPAGSLPPSSLPPPFYLHTSPATLPKIVPPFLPLGPVERKKMVDSISNWFKSGTVPAAPRPLWKWTVDADVDRICGVLALGEVGMDSALSALGVRLNEECVLKVLRAQREVLPALQFFDWAGRQRGYRHSRNCYHAIFKMLSRARLMTVMLDWLERFSNRRPDVFVVRFHDTLVMGYSIAGRIDVALQIFSRMRFQGIDLDGFAYNVLLNSLVEEGSFDVFNVISKQAGARGLRNSITSCIQIRCLCKQGKFDDAKEYLRGLGDAANESVVSVLIDGLCKAHKHAEAERLVREFRDAGKLSRSLTCTTWIVDLVREGKVGIAMDIFRRNGRLGTGDFPGLSCYNALICGLLKESRLEDVYDLLIEMSERNIVPDSYTMNATIGFFCKAGMVDVAIELFDDRFAVGLSPNDYSYNQLINALCENSRIDDAFRVLEDGLKQGYFPGKWTFHILGEALCRNGKLEKMFSLFDAALERHIVPSHGICSRFIAALCRAGRADDAYLLFTKLKKPENDDYMYTYSDLIYGFSAINRGETASRLLLEMVVNGHSPSRGVYKAVIYCLSEGGNQDKVLKFLDVIRNSCQTVNLRHVYNSLIDGAVSVGQPHLASQIFERMLADDCSPNLDTKISMLHCYLRRRRISDAINFFVDLLENQEPSAKLYNAMITGLCEASKIDMALLFWKEAREKGIVPKLDSYEALIHVLCETQKYHIVVEVLKDFEQAGRSPSSYIYNILLCHALKSVELTRAWFKSAGGDLQMGVTTFCRFFNAFATGDGTKGLPILSENLGELIEELFPVNTITYNMLLRALCREGKVDDACNWVNRMRESGHPPNMWTYDILINGFRRYGRLRDAEVWMDEMLQKGYNPCLIDSYRRYRVLDQQ